MRVMAIMKATAQSEAGEMPSERLLADMTAFNEELVGAGLMVGGEGLHPSSAGVRVRFGADGGTEVVPGPFAATGELIAGFWLLDVASMDEAVEWMRRAPNSDGVHREIELRRVFEAEDFGEQLTPELREREETIRDRTGRYREAHG